VHWPTPPGNDRKRLSPGRYPLNSLGLPG
jgi:hypothetical protein